MTTVHGQKEFTPEQIKRQEEKAQDETLTKEERDRAARGVREMEIYNMRALRGDFDSY